MNARLMAACTVGGFALAALLFSSQISAQSAASAQGKNPLFASLRAGQMVQLWTNNFGPMIRTFEDADGKALMTYKIKEIGNDYIVLEFEDKDETGSLFEYRLPVYGISQVVHVGKSTRPAAPSTPYAKPEKKGTTPDKKPGMTKKKN